MKRNHKKVEPATQAKKQPPRPPVVKEKPVTHNSALEAKEAAERAEPTNEEVENLIEAVNENVEKKNAEVADKVHQVIVFETMLKIAGVVVNSEQADLIRRICLKHYELGDAISPAHVLIISDQIKDDWEPK